MSFPRLITTHCVFALLVLSSLVMLCMASAVGSASRKTKLNTATVGLNKIFPNNCNNSKPSFPPSLFIKPCFVVSRRFGKFLRITPDGQVQGSFSLNDNYTELELEIVGTCLIRIKGIATGRYMAMRNVTSEIYTQVQPDQDAVFRSQVIGYFSTLESYQYGWYVGLRKDGYPRKGRNVHPNKRFAAFKVFIRSTQSQSLIPLSL